MLYIMHQTFSSATCVHRMQKSDFSAVNLQRLKHLSKIQKYFIEVIYPTFSLFDNSKIHAEPTSSHSLPLELSYLSESKYLDYILPFSSGCSFSHFYSDFHCFPKSVDHVTIRQAAWSHTIIIKIRPYRTSHQLKDLSKYVT